MTKNDVISWSVARLVKALYGHPDAGTFWEQHSRCVQWVFSRCEEWPSVYTHPELQSVLVAYVDDFKMAGPNNNLKKGLGAAS